MSARVDAERELEAARQRVERGWQRLKVLQRLMQLVADGQSDNAIASALGMQRQDVLALRQVLTIDTGRRAHGRLRRRVKAFAEAFR